MGAKHEALITELRTALRSVAEARAKWQEAKAAALEKKADLTARLTTVAEIEEEIRTGKSGRDIIDKAGTVHTSEPINGSALPNEEQRKAKLAQDALDDLLHASGTEDNLDGKHRKRKAVAS